MKLYMIKRILSDGSEEYRAAGTNYQKWTRQGKCWSGGSFKGFLNYCDKNLMKILEDSDKYETSVLVIDLKGKEIYEVEFRLWVQENL